MATRSGKRARIATLGPISEGVVSEYGVRATLIVSRRFDPLVINAFTTPTNGDQPLEYFVHAVVTYATVSSATLLF